MKRKEKIKIVSLRMFNDKGIRNVTTRHIASKMEISHGNLTYHYPSKKEILEAIYLDMNAGLSKAIKPKGADGLKYLHALFIYFFRFQKKYRFFYTDLIEIARHYPDITEMHTDIQLKRIRECRAVISYYQHIGLMQRETEYDNYGLLIHNIWFLSSFWMNQKGILGAGHPAREVTYTLKIIWNQIVPHLTYKGKQQFKILIKI
jgi:AcrR family transcriptional regulator